MFHQNQITMKKNYYLTGFLMLAFAWMAMDSSGQREVQVAPGIGTLNDAIFGDTTATGDRVDPNTVYVLERGDEAYYGLTGTIEHRDFHLTIKAADGDGARPFLQPRDETGDGSGRAFRPRADLTLMGLHVTNLDQLGGQNTRIIRASGDDINIHLEDCWFDKDGQSFIRVDNPGMNIMIKNCVVSNIGYPNNPNNGRGIDDRGNAIDTLIIENSTFYNISSRIIRDDGGTLGYCKIMNNTFMNVGQHGLSFGPTTKLEAGYNIFVNFGFMPGDAEEPNMLFDIDSVEGVAPEFVLSDNFFYLDTTLVAEFLNDTTSMPMLYGPTMEAYFMETYGEAYKIGKMIEFTDAPPFNDSIIIYDLDPMLDQDDAPFWFEPEPSNGFYHTEVPFDFGYANSVAWGMNNQDVAKGGDPSWDQMNSEFMGIDFEYGWERHVLNQFANAGDAYDNLEVIPNPDPSGINTSDHVLRFTVQDGADPWAGVFTDAFGEMELTQEKHTLEIMVWKDKLSPVGLKVERGTAGDVELKAENTTTSAWETVQIDFDGVIGNTFSRLVFFPDFPGSRTDGGTFYLDNIRIVETPVSVEEDNVNKLRLYPNPAKTFLTVEYTGMKSVVVRDVLGKAVYSLELSGIDQTTLETDDLVSGMYFITVDGQAGSLTTKFLKK
jgi:hypothetical protein